MSTINDLPNPSDFGELFNYAVWTPNTSLQFANVPWNSDYRDIVKFDTRGDLNTYIANNALAAIPSIGHMTYAKMGAPIRLNIPFNQLLGANYVRVTNGAQPVTANYVDQNGNPQAIGDNPIDLYYFVVGINYLAPNTTEIIVQLDVWQTFSWNVSFGNCYIERGHIGVANTKQMQNGGRDYLTVPEGLDIGGEYVMPQYFSAWGCNPDGNLDGAAAGRVLVLSTTNLLANPGTVDAPNLVTATGATMSGVPSGASYWLFSSLADFQTFMNTASQYPWVLQGIIAIYLMPDIIDDFGWVDWENALGSGVTIQSPAVVGAPIAVNKHNFCSVVDVGDPIGTGWRENIMLHAYPERYQYLNKFLTSPYTVLEYTTFNATPVIIKPEGLPDTPESVDANGRLCVDVYLTAAMPGGRLAYVPSRYNNDRPETGVSSTVGEWLDSQVVVSDFPSGSIVNNAGVEWLAANHANLAYAHQSANWAQQKALQGNNVAMQQASANMTNMANQNQIQLNQMNQSTDLALQMSAGHGIMGALQSAVTGFETGGPMGAVAGAAGSAANTAMSMAQIGAQNDINKNAVSAAFGSNYQTAGYMRDTNKQYADYAAQGDYANTVAGIQAQVQSAAMIQPTSAGQVGGNSFTYALTYFRLYIRVKVPQNAHIRAVGEYWLRYGYAVQQFATPPPSLKVMSNFTYWKLRETYLIGTNLQETFKHTIRGIFEKGVTVWSNPADIGTIDMGINTPLPGVTLP